MKVGVDVTFVEIVWHRQETDYSDSLVIYRVDAYPLYTRGIGRWGMSVPVRIGRLRTYVLKYDCMDLEEFLDSFEHQPQSVQKKGRRQRRRTASAAVPHDKKYWVHELLRQISGRDLPAPRLEYVFHAERKWRFDMDWKPHGYLVAVEVDGGMFARPVVCHRCGEQVKRKLQSGRMVIVREGGRHNSGTGYEKDAEKLNEATLYGWRVLRVTPKAIQSGQALDWIERALL